MEEAVRYAKQRSAFGGPIANLQAVQFKLAEMKIGIETARWQTYHAAWLADRGDPHGEAAAIAAAAHVKIWQRVTSLGGVESPLEHRGSVEGTDSPCPMDLLRLSAGDEASADLIADLEQALVQAAEGYS